MADPINVNDTELNVRIKIVAILGEKGVSTENINTWGTAAARLNLAAGWLGLPTIENGMNGAIARARINAINSSPAPALPVNTVTPTITGTAAYNQVLTASTGTWTGYPAITYTYQWKAAGVNISGATSATYTVAETDLGKVITVDVIATNLRGATTATSVATAEAVSVPVNNVAPTISGTVANGQTLTASTGTWIAYPSPTYTYRWKEDGVNISGAESSTFVLTNSQVGKVITVEVIATNTEGSNAVISSGTTALTSAPINTVLPSVAAEAVEGSTLTASNGTWIGYPSITYTYQWQRNGANISGATSSTYVVASIDLGNAIGVVVTATNSLGSQSATSVTQIAKPIWAQGSSSWRNLMSNIGNSPVATDIHVSDIFARNSNGSYSSFAPNILVRTDLGIQTTPTRTKIVLQSFHTNASPWLNYGATSSAGNTYTDLLSGVSIQSQFVISGGEMWHRRYQTSVPFVSGTVYAIKAWYKAGTSPNRIFAIENPSPQSTSSIDGAIGTTTTSNSAGSLTNVSDILLDNGVRELKALFTPNFTNAANVGFGPSTTSEGLTVEFIGMEIEAGMFSTPPADVLGTALTINGNQPTIKYPNFSLDSGVSGFLVSDILEPGSNFVNLLKIYEEANQANRLLLFYSSGKLVFDVRNANVSSARIEIGDWPTGPCAVAFMAAQDYFRARIVGQADISAVISGTYPLGMNTLALGNQGDGAVSNTYQRSKLLSLNTDGTFNSTMFDNIYANAQLALASI